MKRLSVIVVLSISISSVFPIAAKDEPRMEEIIVSATYRDVKLMDVPIAITAVTALELETKGIENIQTLYQVIPGMSYGSNSATYNTITIRGLTPPAGGQAVVGVYMDNVPITSSTGVLTQVLGSTTDLQRVEVLRGPQGTLYGEGNMGGAIRYITKNPDPSAFDWKIKVAVEQNSESDGLSYNTDFMLNIPLFNNSFAVRIVGNRRDRTGFMDASLPRGEDDINWEEEDAFRIKMAWDVNDNLSLAAMVNYSDSEFGAPGLAFHCYTEANLSDPNGQIPSYDLPGETCDGKDTDQFNHRDPYVTHLAHPDFTYDSSDEHIVYNFSVDWELPWATFTSSSSYFDRLSRHAEETSPRFSGGLVAAFGGAFGLAGLGGDGAFRRDVERKIQEFRLVSNKPDSSWQWTLGAYYKDDTSITGKHTSCAGGGSAAYAATGATCWLQYFFQEGTPAATQESAVNLITGIIGGSRAFNDYEETAVYGEVSYRFNEQWELLVGLRLANTSYDLDLAQPLSNSRSNLIDSLSTDDDIVSPKVTLTWRPNDDLMTYFTYAQGYRPGIINTGLSARVAGLELLKDTDPAALEHYNRLVDQRITDGDQVLNYEVGLKATLLNGRVQLTSSIYNMDWEDVLVTVTDVIDGVFTGVSPLGYSFSINSGDAQSQGIEIEVAILLNDSMRLNFGGDNNWKAEIGSGGVSGRYGGVGVDPGNRLGKAPKTSGYVSFNWNFPISDWSSTFSVNATYVDDQFADSNNERVSPSYTKVDLKLTGRRNGWMVAAYVRNAFDDVIVYEFNAVGYRFGRPRTVGIEFSYSPGQ